MFKLGLNETHNLLGKVKWGIVQASKVGEHALDLACNLPGHCPYSMPVLVNTVNRGWGAL